MPWVGGDVVFLHSTPDETDRELHAWAVENMPSSCRIVAPVSVVHGHRPHMTLVYWKKGAATPEFDAAVAEMDLPHMEFSGTCRGAYRVCNAERGVFCVALDIECAEIQDVAPAARGLVEKHTGEPCQMAPHVGPDGQCGYYRNDFHPHVTLGYYHTQAALDADWARMDRSAFDGRAVEIANFKVY